MLWFCRQCSVLVDRGLCCPVRFRRFLKPDEFVKTPLPSTSLKNASMLGQARVGVARLFL
ncbi:MAG: hypothetical protein ACI8RZ_006901 [Myxococcota bacterium]|jgi:hypothetical protein